MKSKVYDILKACGQVILPAILTFIGVCGKELGWECIGTILNIGTGFIAMWNSIIVIWNANYYKELNGVADNNIEDLG